MKKDLPIVLTGTILANTSDNVLSYEERKADYLRAIKYYVQYAPVIFVENSGYNFDDSDGFYEIDNLKIIQFPKSGYYERGKGFQEFEMMDKFVESIKGEYDAFIKVTGRYIISDFEKIYTDVLTADRDFIIDTSYKDKRAYTYMFYTTTIFYEKFIMGIYKKCDDRKPSKSIEDIMYSLLQGIDTKQYRFFLNAYNILGKSGSNGKPLVYRPCWKLWRRTLISRKFRYYILGKQELRGV